MRRRASGFAMGLAGGSTSGFKPKYWPNAGTRHGQQSCSRDLRSTCHHYPIETRREPLRSTRFFGPYTRLTSTSLPISSAETYPA